VVDEGLEVDGAAASPIRRAGMDAGRWAAPGSGSAAGSGGRMVLMT
jgi:hypothetical protein